MYSRYEIRVSQRGDMVRVSPLGFEKMMDGREIADPSIPWPSGLAFLHPEENNQGYRIRRPTEKKIKEAVSKLEGRLRKKIERELKVWRALNSGKTPPEIPIAVVFEKT